MGDQVLSDEQLCSCGCGNPVPNAVCTRKDRGQVKGRPVRFIRGHNRLSFNATRPWVNAIRVAGGCLEWAGTVNQRGRAVVRIAGKHKFVARLVMERELSRPLLRQEYVCHRCDNAKCIEVSHLFIGSHADNMADMVAKGRQARGEKHGQRKLQESDVKAIRDLLAAGAASKREIGRRFGVHDATVYNIAKGRTWRATR